MTVNTPFGQVATPVVPRIPTASPAPWNPFGGNMLPTSAGLNLNPPSAADISGSTGLFAAPPKLPPIPGGYGESTNPVFGWQPGSNYTRSSDNNTITPLPLAGPPAPRVVPNIQGMMQNLKGLLPKPAPFKIYPSALTS